MKNIKESNFYHFSVDDVFQSLIEITDRKIGLFEHPFFSFLKNIHDEFDTNVDLYLFFQKEVDGKLRNLKEISESIKETLIKNTWIRFGPHSLDPLTKPYSQTPNEQIEDFDKIYNEISRFSGIENISKWVRLHYFSESYELRDYFKSKGVEGLFTTDKDRITTRMSNSVNESLRKTGFAEHNGLKLIRSNIRIENISSEDIRPEELLKLVKDHLEKYGHICFFTHEYELVSDKNKFVEEKLCEKTRNITKELIKELYNSKIPSI